MEGFREALRKGGGGVGGFEKGGCWGDKEGIEGWWMGSGNRGRGDWRRFVIENERGERDAKIEEDGETEWRKKRRRMMGLLSGWWN